MYFPTFLTKECARNTCNYILIDGVVYSIKYDKPQVSRNSLRSAPNRAIVAKVMPKRTELGITRITVIAYKATLANVFT